MDFFAVSNINMAKISESTAGPGRACACACKVEPKPYWPEFESRPRDADACMDATMLFALFTPRLTYGAVRKMSSG